jgi:hypothetical protein
VLPGGTLIKGASIRAISTASARSETSRALRPSARTAKAGEYETPYGRERSFPRQLDEGELTALIVASPAWQETVKARCDELDLQAPASRPARAYKGVVV